MILLSKAIRESEQLTMNTEPIRSIDLMERAGTICTEFLLQHIPVADYDKILIFCGPGNNGGDGLVIARLLVQQNFPVEVILCNETGKTSTEFAENLKRLREISFPHLSIHEFDPALISPNAPILIIDALFGIGLSKPLTGYYAGIVDLINATPTLRIAIDVPSGLFIDEHTPFHNKVIQATLTLTFQFQKLAYVMAENAGRVGQVEILDIGLRMPEDSDDEVIPVVEEALAKQILRPVPLHANKGTFGHALLIAGSGKMPGAAVLAANAALRAGAGKLTVHLPASIAGNLPFALPEAMVNPDKNEEYFTAINLENYPDVNALAIGPGLGQNQQTKAALSSLLDEIQIPVILDADALNILADNKTWLAYLPSGTILTPHPKEFERLAGKATDDFDRWKKAVEFAVRYSVTLILKGHNTLIAMPDGNYFFNTTGNPGMATAGSGDVLTGILLGLLTRGYQPEEAAILGTYLHGAAGDLAITDDESMESLIASDIYKCLGKAYSQLKNQNLKLK